MIGPMLTLSPRDTAMLDGDLGDGLALAMRIVAATARVMDADTLIDISSAHIDGCLYHGAASLDFVERFVASGAKVAVPTTLKTALARAASPRLVAGLR